MTTPPSPDRGQVRPRKLWFWVGGAVIVLGVVSGIVGFALGITSAVDAAGIDTEFDAGESTTFQAEEANTDSDSWMLYSNETPSSLHPDEECALTGPDGREVGMSAPSYSSEVTVNGQTWVLAAQLDITEPGEHTITCSDSAGDRFGLGYGPGFAESALGIVGSIVMLVVLPLLGFVVGIVVIVVTAVRRANHWRRLQATAAPPTGFQGPAGWYGPGGYPGPPGGA